MSKGAEQRSVADVSLVRTLLREQFSDLVSLPIEPIESPGTDNSIFRLGDDLCVRLPKVAWAAETAPREVSILRHFESMSLQVPRPMHMGAPGAGYQWGWSVMSWIGGQAVGMRDLCGEEAVSLASFILDLRAHSNLPEFMCGAANNYRGCPLRERQVPLDAAFADLETMLDVGVLRRIWQCALDAGEADVGDWIHGDLHGGNLLQRGGKLVAVIDWGLAGVGDGACDLQPAWCLMDGAAREAFWATLGADEAARMRGAGWALSVAAIYLAYYRHRGTPVDMSRRTLDRLIEAFS